MLQAAEAAVIIAVWVPCLAGITTHCVSTPDQGSVQQQQQRQQQQLSVAFETLSSRQQCKQQCVHACSQ
jgi:hypothetical protein